MSVPRFASLRLGCSGLGAALLLPAQGGWLVFAMRDGGVWWLVWAAVLVGLVACTVVTAVQDHRLGPNGRPAIATPVNVAVLLALLGWILVALVR